jgi:hypothetical protein
VFLLRISLFSALDNNPKNQYNPFNTTPITFVASSQKALGGFLGYLYSKVGF